MNVKADCARITTERGADDIAEVLSVLSVETRLRILALLSQQDLCVGALARRLGLTQGAVSQHLKILRDAGLLRAQRIGHHVHYRVHSVGLLAVSRRVAEWLDAIGQEAASRPAVASRIEACGAEERETPCVRRTRKTAARKTSV